MRQGSAPKRGRGRSGGRRGYVNAANRTYDSNGPDVKVRGTAAHIYDKYQALARDASSSGDRIAAENYLQHAEHYFRLMAAHAAAQQLQQQQQQQGGQPANGQQPRANGQSSEHVAEGDGEEIDASAENANAEGNRADNGGGENSGGGNNGRRQRRRGNSGNEQAAEPVAAAEPAAATEPAAESETEEQTEEATA